jgi:MFS family permease
MDPTLNSETKGSFASETVSLNSDSQARVVLGEKTSFAANVESHDQIVPLPPKTDETLAYNEISWQELMTTCIPIALICLLVWLDEGILATAIPRISDEFNSFDQIGWYGPSYLFGLCASQLPFGKAYKDCSPKVVYLISLLIFEVGSILQAAAPSSEAFIVGRVFAGIGGAGVLAGSLTIFSEDIPKAKLPYVMGTFGLVHSAGGVAGPVIGGAITSSSLTWRWYITSPSFH